MDFFGVDPSRGLTDDQVRGILWVLLEYWLMLIQFNNLSCWGFCGGLILCKNSWTFLLFQVLHHAKIYGKNCKFSDSRPWVFVLHNSFLFLFFTPKQFTYKTGLIAIEYARFFVPLVVYLVNSEDKMFAVSSIVLFWWTVLSVEWGKEN